MPRMERRNFRRAFKLKRIERLEAGESDTAPALEMTLPSLAPRAILPDTGLRRPFP